MVNNKHLYHIINVNRYFLYKIIFQIKIIHPTNGSPIRQITKTPFKNTWIQLYERNYGQPWHWCPSTSRSPRFLFPCERVPFIYLAGVPRALRRNAAQISQTGLPDSEIARRYTIFSTIKNDSIPRIFTFLLPLI